MRSRRLYVFIPLFICLSLLSNPVSAQEKKLIWWPDNKVFPLLTFDLLEVQPYVGVMALSAPDSSYTGAYIPVNLGFRKSIIEWPLWGMQFNFGLGAAAYTQFEISRFDDSTLRGGLLNVDYKVSGFLFMSKKVHRFRWQLFHISSHLGDDYMLRNQFYELNDKTVNYEQLDLTYLLAISHLTPYVGVGYIISPNTFRQRLMIEMGVQCSKELNPELQFTWGTDIKLYDEYDFKPSIHLGAGITLKQREKRQITFLIDGYYGHLPYSTLDYGRLYWIGLSSKIFL